MKTIFHILLLLLGIFVESGETRTMDRFEFQEICASEQSASGVKNCSSGLLTGKEWESETGTYYFGARRYDPTIGMWYGRDPAGQFESPYVYAGNGMNPVRSFDGDARFLIALPAIPAALEILANVVLSASAVGLTVDLAMHQTTIANDELLKNKPLINVPLPSRPEDIVLPGAEIVESEPTVHGTPDQSGEIGPQIEYTPAEPAINPRDRMVTTFEEWFKNPEDALGCKNGERLEHLFDDPVKDQGIRDMGYKIKRYYLTSEGVKRGVFYNKELGRYSDGHTSSHQWDGSTDEWDGWDD